MLPKLLRSQSGGYSRLFWRLGEVSSRSSSSATQSRKKTILNLNCWILDEDYKSVFPVGIKRTMTVGDLKTAIKDSQPIYFQHVDSRNFNLWKISVFDDASLNRNVDDLVLQSKPQLLPCTKLSNVFLDEPKDEHVHIVVQPPSGEPPSKHPRREEEPHTSSTSVNSRLFDPNFQRKWSINGAISGPDTARYYYLNPEEQEVNKVCIDAVLEGRFVMLSGARASGKTTRLSRLLVQLREMGYLCLSLSLDLMNLKSAETFWISFGQEIQYTLGRTNMKPICTQLDFLNTFTARLWKNQNIVLFVDEFSELYGAPADVKNDCLRAFRNIRNHNEKYAIRSIICAGTFSILHLNPTDSSISPFNVSDSIQNPYFSLKETRTLFDQFARDNNITMDDGILNDIWTKSNGHPGMVGLCGRFISKKFAQLIDRDRTLSYDSWERIPVEELYTEIYGYNTFRSMVTSLIRPEATLAIKLLRSQFAGFLDVVKIVNQDENLADFLTAEGVLLRLDVLQRRYRMASPLIDGLMRSHVIPVQFPSAPSITPPLQDDGTLHVLDTLIESLRFFDKDHIRLARSRSYKLARVKVGGNSSTVPRESVYDTELMRILTNWLQKQYGWTVTGQWHLRTTPGEHKYSNIVLEKDGTSIVLEILATGDRSFVQSHIEKTSAYKALLSADDAWVVHFTCEDDYDPVWQSDAELNEGVNVVHFLHDLEFTRVWMQARWKNDVDIVQDSRALDI